VGVHDLDLVSIALSDGFASAARASRVDVPTATGTG